MSSHNGKHHPVRGAMAGVAGGLIASWVMNEFMAGPGKKIQESVQDPEQQNGQKTSEEETATMKTADAIAETVTGGQHLSHEGKQKGGVVVHYGYGALMGGLYGSLAEYWKAPKAGLGTVFGSVLFGAGDLLAVPALNLGPSPTEQPPSAQTNPFLAHLVYGTATELTRRAVRAVL